jgi:CubicO group peptidase (beta-lactamase class C family)
MPETVYGPVSRSSSVAPAEQILPGAPRLWGAPHDDNAALMGGIAGHAGVFSTPADLAAYAEYLLTPRTNSPLGDWLHASLTPHASIEPGTDRGLAWILTADSQVAYHHGFTGTSLYLNPERGSYIVICTNAIYHSPARDRLRPLRDLALLTTAQP